jgi:hypothetical protein
LPRNVSCGCGLTCRNPALSRDDGDAVAQLVILCHPTGREIFRSIELAP